MEKPNFKKMCLMYIQQLTNFPYIEKDFDALTDYQFLCKVVAYLNKIITNENTQNETITALYNAFVELKDYFDNLDVQEEINNKLDEMASDGTLEQIIEQFINSSTLWCFDTVADMKDATNLINGSYAKTLGYYEINDGGSSLYKIRTITNEDVIDEGSLVSLDNNTLVAELVIQNDFVTLKQFGAIGDGETNDVSYIQNAINSNAKIIDFLDKTYMVNNTLTFKSKSYIGNNATIILGTQSIYREHVIRNEHYAKLEEMDDIIMKGLTIVNNANETAFGFSCAKVVVENCKFFGYKLSTHGILDFYANNSNSVVKDSYFKIELSSSSERGGPIEIRGFHGGITKNFLVSNCYFEQNSKDEMFWINAGLCPIEDVIVENCIFKATGTNANMLWISNATSTGNTTYVKNVTYKNNTIIQDVIQDRLITIGVDEGGEHQDLMNCKNIVFENNLIIINDQDSSHNRVIVYGDENSEPELIVRNNKFIYNGETKNLEFILNGKIKSYNNVFDVKNASYIYRGCYDVNGDLINNCNHIGRNINIIRNINATCSTSAILDIQAEKYYNVTKILNSNIKCTNLLANGSNNIGRVYQISNNTIDNSSHIYNNYGGDNTNIVKLNNNVLTYSSNYINNVACQLHLGINYNSNGDIIKGIPGNALNRGSCVVGTILFSNTATKTIVRKTSEGDSADNWEEV